MRPYLLRASETDAREADVATAGFEALTGQPLQEMTDLFASYEVGCSSRWVGAR